MAQFINKSGTVNGTLRGNILKLVKYFQDNPDAVQMATLQKRLKTPKRTLYRWCHRLEKAGILKHESQTWEVCHFQGTPLKMAHLLAQGDNQLHDFTYVLRLVKVPVWWGSKRKKLQAWGALPSEWGNNRYEQARKRGFLIQFFSQSITFINQARYWGQTPYHCFIQAVFDLLNCIQGLEREFNTKLHYPELPHVYCRSQHNVKLGDWLAKYCLAKRGRNFEVQVADGRKLWIDTSDPVGMEASEAEDLRVYGEFWKDYVAMDEPVKMSELVRTVAEVVQNQAVFAENMRSHIDAIQRLAGSAKSQEGATIALTEAVNKLTRKVSEKQSRLGDFS